MSETVDNYVRYKRSRFATRLPVDRMYTASHCWLKEADAGTWQVGLTQFATRMLGETVEHEFEINPNESAKVGQIIGWIEGFKAASDLYCVVDGDFVGGNPALEKDVTLVHSDPYGEGWLYAVKGSVDEKAVDVNGYIEILDMAIDAVQGKQQQGTIE